VRDFGRIHGVDHVENLGGFFGLVRLQVPDKVIAGVRAIGQLGALQLELLHIVFAEVAQTELVSVANHAGGKFLGHRDELNIGTLAPRARRCGYDAGFHLD